MKPMAGMLRRLGAIFLFGLCAVPDGVAQNVSILSGPTRGSAMSARSEATLLERPARLVIRDLALPMALTELHHRAGVPLVFSETILPGQSEVSCACAEATVREALDTLLMGTGLHYAELRTQIIIEPGSSPVEQQVLPGSSLSRSMTLPLSLKPVSPKTRRSAANPSIRVREPATIRGVVREADGSPVPAVSITIEPLSLSTVTDRNGAYSLLVPERHVQGQTVTVTARSVGYRTLEQTLALSAGIHNIDFTMEMSIFSLDGLVVTGVVDPVEGVKLPMVVGKLKAEDITTIPTTGAALNVLQGKMAGVHVVRRSGQPGSEADIRIRAPITVLGSGSLMYIVDGVILGEGTADIETLDIESIEVIKGAAAASLYGSRAAAGVIQITTRRGSEIARGATRISARTEYGWSELSNLRVPLSSYHRYLVNDDGQYIDADGNPVSDDRSARVIALDDIQDRAYPTRLYRDSNLRELYNPGQFFTSNVTLSQNFENTNYAISFNRYKEAGALRGNDGYERYNGKVNVDHRLADNFSLSLSAYHNTSTSDEIDGNPFSSILLYVPDVNLAQRDSLGNYLQYPNASYTTRENPVWRQTTRDNYSERARTLASAGARYSPFDWLRIAAQYSYDRSDRRDQIYEPLGIPTSPDEHDRVPTEGRVYWYSRNNNSQNGSLMTTFQYRLGEWNPRLTLGATMERNDYYSFSADGRNLAVGGLPRMSIGREQVVSNSIRGERTNGRLADLAIDYAGKYIGSFVLRRDGSSLFGASERWHDYYAARIAYRMSEESWWPFKEVLTEFKPRLAIGTAGGRPGFEYQYETWDVNLSADRSTLSFGRGTFGNQFLKPERTTEREIGLDMVLFGRAQLQLTYVRQVTDDLILQLPQPGITGYTRQYKNIGAQSGKTFEAELETSVLEIPGKLSWNASVVLDRSDSWVSRWDRPAYFNAHRRFGPGSNLYKIWGERLLTSMDDLGTKGRVAPEYWDQFDVNDDGYVVWVGKGNSWKDGWDGGTDGSKLWGTNTVIDGQTYHWGFPIVELTETGAIARVEMGDSRPDLNWGFINNIRYKNFRIYAHLRGQVGGQIYNSTKQGLYGQRRHGDVDQADKAPEAKKPTSYYVDGLYRANGWVSHFVEPAGFLKLQALNVSYDFDKKRLARIFGERAPERLSIGLNGRNIFTATKYTGFDPDVGSTVSRVDDFVYPNMRQWTGVVEITF